MWAAAGGARRADEPDRPGVGEFGDTAGSRYIVETLELCNWNISRAAGMLGVERTNLHKKMRGFGIRRGS